MFSGLGNDFKPRRSLLVGPIYGMPALGVYSVIILATTLPIGRVFRVIGTLNLAIFYNSALIKARFQRNVQLAKNVTAVVACLYAGGVILLTNVVVPLVFGQKFVAPPLASVCWGWARLSESCDPNRSGRSCCKADARKGLRWRISSRLVQWVTWWL